MVVFDTMELLMDHPRELVATLLFNQPQKLNSLSLSVIRDFSEALNIIEKSANQLRAIIITGSGKAFVAGADIPEMLKMNPPLARSYLYTLQQIFNRLENLRLPVIAAINGYAFGGGLELALACDIRIAADTAIMGLPEVTLGLIPSAGGTQRLTRVVGESLAKFMIMTAERIDAKTAFQRGIVAKVVPTDSLDNEIDNILDTILKLAPYAIGAAKIAIQASLDESLTSGLEIELNEAVNCFQTRDLREGMKAFVEKRKPNFTGD